MAVRSENENTMDGEWALSGALIPGLPAGGLRLGVDGGRITMLEPRQDDSDAVLTLLPLLSNSHDHGRGQGTVLGGHLDEPLERWLTGLAPTGDASAQYAWVTAASARMLASGIGAAVCCVNMHTDDVDYEVVEACRACLDVGIRAAVVYPITADSPPDVFDRVDKLDAEFAGPLLDIQVGPVNPQWVPEPLLAATAEYARRSGRWVHMHLLETPAQREWADSAHPEGVLPWLDNLGLLGPGTTLAHGTHLRPEEMALIDARGCCVALNASSNLRLASGVPPVAMAIASLRRAAMGLDGLALGDDADAWTELRLLRGLAQGQAHAKVPAEQIMALGGDAARCGLGRSAPNAVDIGNVADFVLADLRPWRHLVGCDGWTAAEIVVCAMSPERVREVWVGGRRVM